MTTTSPFERVLETRASDRLARAEMLAGRALADLRVGGFEARIIGSLAAGRFRLHSDIDVLVSGPIDPVRRVAADGGGDARDRHPLRPDLHPRPDAGPGRGVRGRRMIASRHPVFARLGLTLERAGRELA